MLWTWWYRQILFNQFFICNSHAPQFPVNCLNVRAIYWQQVNTLSQGKVSVDAIWCQHPLLSLKAALYVQRGWTINLPHPRDPGFDSLSNSPLDKGQSSICRVTWWCPWLTQWLADNNSYGQRSGQGREQSMGWGWSGDLSEASPPLPLPHCECHTVDRSTTGEWMVPRIPWVAPLSNFILTEPSSSTLRHIRRLLESQTLNTHCNHFGISPKRLGKALKGKAFEAQTLIGYVNWSGR